MAQHDILIRGGLLFDGSGRPGVPGDVAIAEGRIAKIAPRIDDTAGKTIDAVGLAVAPGFIDIKTHYQFTLPINPKAESKVRQGVTTEIVGHCGFSVAPVLGGKVDLLRDYLSPSAPWTPVSRAELRRISRQLPRHLGERRHAGWPQYAPADGDGDGRARADCPGTRRDDRVARTRSARRRTRTLHRAVHAAGSMPAPRRSRRSATC